MLGWLASASCLAFCLQQGNLVEYVSKLIYYVLSKASKMLIVSFSSPFRLEAPGGSYYSFLLEEARLPFLALACCYLALEWSRTRWLPVSSGPSYLENILLIFMRVDSATIARATPVL